MASIRGRTIEAQSALAKQMRSRRMGSLQAEKGGARLSRALSRVPQGSPIAIGLSTATSAASMSRGCKRPTPDALRGSGRRQVDDAGEQLAVFPFGTAVEI